MTKRFLLLLTLLLTLGATAPSTAPQTREFRIPHEKYVLANGLNVILHVDRSAPVASVYVSYAVGSGHEKAGKTGFAHLFEHLMFNASQHLPQGEFSRRIRAVGGTFNGRTTRDSTVYFETVPASALEMVLWMESDRMGFLLPTVAGEAFAIQQNVVRNERRQKVDSQALGHWYEVLNKTLYPKGHPYGWSGFGEPEDLATATVQDAIDFHKAYYQPANATLVVAGGIDVGQTKRWIEKYFGDLPSEPKAPSLPVGPVTLPSITRVYYEDRLVTSPHLAIAFPTVERGHPDSHAVNELGGLLCGSNEAPLVTVLRDEKRLIARVEGQVGGERLAGGIIYRIWPLPGSDLGEIEVAFREALERFERDGFRSETLEVGRFQTESHFFEQIQSPAEKARLLGDLNTSAGSPEYLNTDMQRQLGVTSEDIWRVFRKYMKNKPYVVLSIVPHGRSALAVPGSRRVQITVDPSSAPSETAAAATVRIPTVRSRFDRTVAPPLGKEQSVVVPAVWSGRTTGGIPVIGVSRHDIPVVEFRITMPGGRLADAPGKEGTAFLLAELMNGGTRNRTSGALREALGLAGGQVWIRSSAESMTVTGSCFANRLTEVMSLVREMMLEPRWDEAALGSTRARTVSYVSGATGLSATADSVFARLAYGTDSIFAGSSLGTPASLTTITLADLRRHYEDYFVADHATVTMVGDITMERALAAVGPLDSWKRGSAPLPRRRSESARPGVYFLDAPGATQSQIRIGHRSVTATDPDCFGVKAMNQRLGGDSNSALNRVLREQMGITYGARSTFASFSGVGLFVVSTAVQSDATLRAARAIRSELERYRSGISGEDLSVVKTTLMREYAGKFQTLKTLSAMLDPIASYGYALDYAVRNRSIIEELTTREHTRLAREHIQPDRLIHLIVGDRATQFDRLRDLGLGEPILVDRDGKPVVSGSSSPRPR